MAPRRFAKLPWNLESDSLQTTVVLTGLPFKFHVSQVYNTGNHHTYTHIIPQEDRINTHQAIIKTLARVSVGRVSAVLQEDATVHAANDKLNKNAMLKQPRRSRGSHVKRPLVLSYHVVKKATNTFTKR